MRVTSQVKALICAIMVLADLETHRLQQIALRERSDSMTDPRPGGR
jgi:hypothetical protein